jgi:hypothetical protein
MKLMEIALSNVNHFLSQVATRESKPMEIPGLGIAPVFNSWKARSDQLIKRNI